MKIRLERSKQIRWHWTCYQEGCNWRSLWYRSVRKCRRVGHRHAFTHLGDVSGLPARANS